MPQHAKQMERVGIGGIGGERGAIAVLGLGEAARAVRGIRSVECGIHDARTDGKRVFSHTAHGGPRSADRHMAPSRGAA
jgi:3-(3-hydroxy-phenyl)propionate hydroxylase